MANNMTIEHGSDWPKGSVIEFADEQFRILENYGSRGDVEYLDGTFAFSRFYWTFDGQKCKLISKPDQKKITLPKSNCDEARAIYAVKGRAHRLGIGEGIFSIHNNYNDANENKNAIVRKGFDCQAKVITIENALKKVGEINNSINHYDWLNTHLNDFWLNAFGKSLSECGYGEIITSDADKCDGYKKRWEAAGIPFPHGIAIYLLSKASYFHNETYVSPCDLVINNYLPLREKMAGFN
jgi:hypothetical protein